MSGTCAHHESSCCKLSRPIRDPQADRSPPMPVCCALSARLVQHNAMQNAPAVFAPSHGHEFHPEHVHSDAHVRVRQRIQANSQDMAAPSGSPPAASRPPLPSRPRPTPAPLPLPLPLPLPCAAPRVPAASGPVASGPAASGPAASGPATSPSYADRAATAPAAAPFSLTALCCGGPLRPPSCYVLRAGSSMLVTRKRRPRLSSSRPRREGRCHMYHHGSLHWEPRWP